MKRILTVQDISCVGRCSLTVARPILSVMGLETAILPTAVLSTHTQFTGFTFRDLTDDLSDIAAHWKKENLDFEAVYTGYLGSARQISFVSSLFEEYAKGGCTSIVDPVMGDNGKLYTGFDEKFASEMALLCQKADYILPNRTEAAYMLKEEYKAEGYTEKEIQDVLRRLCGLGAKIALLTGVSLHEKELGVMAYDSVSDTFYSYFNEKIPVSYHGTGDCFASCFTGAILRGQSLQEAIKLSADFIVACLKATMADPNRRFYGVNFEKALPLLLPKA